jgi:hypothetical protein
MAVDDNANDLYYREDYLVIGEVLTDQVQKINPTVGLGRGTTSFRRTCNAKNVCVMYLLDYMCADGEWKNVDSVNLERTVPNSSGTFSPIVSLDINTTRKTLGAHNYSDSAKKQSKDKELGEEKNKHQDLISLLYAPLSETILTHTSSCGVTIT